MKKDILKEEFEKEIDLPESLSKNNMRKTLKEKGVTPEKKAKVKILPKVLSAAAMFIILINFLLLFFYLFQLLLVRYHHHFHLYECNTNMVLVYQELFLYTQYFFQYNQLRCYDTMLIY